MIWLSLLLVVAVISGNEAYEKLEITALQHDVLAKGMLLQTFSLYLQKMYTKVKNNRGEEVVTGITKIPPEDDSELISAIYDRYVGFRLTINYLACLAFYKAGAAAPEAGEAEQCEEYFKYVHWFNGTFTAEEFFVQLKYRGTTDATYNLRTVVDNLRILYERQDVMIKAFEKAGQEENAYVNVFKYLRQFDDDSEINPNLTENDAKPLEKSQVQRGEVEDRFRTESLVRFYAFYGKELLYVESFWNLFFSKAANRPLVTHPRQMVRDPQVEEDAQRSHFKVMEESNLDVTVFGVGTYFQEGPRTFMVYTKLNGNTFNDFDYQNAHEVMYAGLLYHGLEMRVRNVGDVLEPKKWQIMPAPPGSQVDFHFVFLEDPPVLGGVGSSSGTAAEGGGDVFGGDFPAVAGTSGGTGMEIS